MFEPNQRVRVSNDKLASYGLEGLVIWTSEDNNKVKVKLDKTLEILKRPGVHNLIVTYIPSSLEAITTPVEDDNQEYYGILYHSRNPEIENPINAIEEIFVGTKDSIKEQVKKYMIDIKGLFNTNHFWLSITKKPTKIEVSTTIYKVNQYGQ